MYDSQLLEKKTVKAPTKMVYVIKGKRYNNAKSIADEYGVSVKVVYNWAKNRMLPDGTVFSRIRVTTEIE